MLAFAFPPLPSSSSSSATCSQAIVVAGDSGESR